MKIREKTMIMVVVAFLCLIGILYAVTNTILLSGFVNLEKQQTIRNTERARDILLSRNDSLNTKISDWGAWDDTYNFMKDFNRKFIEANLMLETFVNLNIDFMVFVDNDGRPVYWEGYDKKTGVEKKVPSGFLEYVRSGKLPVRNPNVKGQFSGIVLVPEGTLMISGYSIITSKYKGPPRGTLIFGVFLNKNEMREISKIAHLPVEIQRIDSQDLPAGYRDARKLLSAKEPLSVIVESAEYVTGYAIINGVNSKPVLILKIVSQREIVKKGLSSIRYFAILMLIIGLLVYITFYIALERLVLARVAKLSADVSAIGAGSDFTARIKVTGSDELSKLGSDVNGMINALAQSQEALRGERNFTSAVVETIGALLVVLDKNGGIIHFNQAFEKTTGYAFNELTGRLFWDAFVPQDQKEMVKNAFRRIIANEYPLEEENHILTKKGELRLIAWSNNALLDKQGEIEFVLATGIDITERNKAVEQLRDSEDKYRVVVESASESIFAIDKTLKIISVNKIGAERMGKTPQELIGSNAYDFLSDEFVNEHYKYLIELYKTGRQVGPIRTEIPVPAGSIWMDIILTPVKDQENNVIYAIGIGRDVTEQKHSEEQKEALEQQLLQAQKMEAVGTLAGGIAHDFNNMLAIIMGNAQLAALDLKPGKPGHREFTEIIRAVERAKDLTMKLLTFARKEKILVKTVSVNKIIKDLVAILERSISKKIEIKVMLTESLPAISVDMNQIHQAFLNICNNACDVMPRGGVLTFESRVADAAECGDENCADGDKGCCHVRISDTGGGIPAEVLNKIFDPFFTTKERGKGTGLGLSVTLGIIQNHGGRITVENKEGGGTEVNVYLPFSDTKEITEETEADEVIARGTETILIVDDEKSVLEVAEKTLLKAGYLTIVADGGEKAINLYKANKDKIALVLLDMVMPDIGAKEVQKAIKKINPDAKIVLSSGHSIEGQAGEMMADGVNGFVQKPYTIVELCRSVREVLDE
jgi:PAS domain S-box-containing protein